MAEMIPHVDLELSSTLDQMVRKDLGSRVWRRKMRGRELTRRAEHGEGEGVGEGERVCDLNVVGPKTVETQFNQSDRLSRPVRPVWPRLIGEVLVLCFAV